jgi:hypothetical protein
MTTNEKRLLSALAWMCEQYIGSGQQDWLDHECMGAGEALSLYSLTMA